MPVSMLPWGSFFIGEFQELIDRHAGGPWVGGSRRRYAPVSLLPRGSFFFGELQELICSDHILVDGPPIGPVTIVQTPSLFLRKVSRFASSGKREASLPPPICRRCGLGSTDKACREPQAAPQKMIALAKLGGVYKTKPVRARAQELILEYP